jgi:hypothetical protein
MLSYRAQAGNLQSQIDDLRDELDQEYGQGPCGDPATCVSVDCIGCCAWQYKITAPEGSAERSAQEAARAQRLLQCQRIEMTCMFKNFNQGADQLFNPLRGIPWT